MTLVHDLDELVSIMRESQTDPIERVDMENALARLTAEEKDIVMLWIWHGMNFDEIGEVVGRRYRGRPLTGSAIRYHKARILVKMHEFLGQR